MNYHKLHNVCNMKITTARKLGDFVPCGIGGYTFIDNGADVLGVAHLDTVQTNRKFRKAGNKVYSPRLDDRLGVYTLLHELDDLNIDILLTEGEESLQSTAQFFATNKQYNWLFQFDRSGIDVVMYQFENQDDIDRLEEIGWTVNTGSYSDICELDILNCTAFNFGTAYYQNHALTAYANIQEYHTCVTLFRDFYDRYSQEYLPYISAPVKRRYHVYVANRYDRMYDRWDDWYKDNAIKKTISCPVCKRFIIPADKNALETCGMCKDCREVFGECPVCRKDTLPIDVPYLQKTGMCESCNYWLNRYHNRVNSNAAD